MILSRELILEAINDADAHIYLSDFNFQYDFEPNITDTVTNEWYYNGFVFDIELSITISVYKENFEVFLDDIKDIDLISFNIMDDLGTYYNYQNYVSDADIENNLIIV